VTHPQTEVTDIYDTAINPEPQDTYDEAIPQPVSVILLVYILCLFWSVPFHVVLPGLVTLVLLFLNSQCQPCYNFNQ